MKRAITALVSGSGSFVPELWDDSALAQLLTKWSSSPPKPVLTHQSEPQAHIDPRSALVLWLYGTRAAVSNKSSKPHLQMQRTAVLLGLRFGLFSSRSSKVLDPFQQCDQPHAGAKLEQGLNISAWPLLCHPKKVPRKLGDWEARIISLNRTKLMTQITLGFTVVTEVQPDVGEMMPEHIPAL